MLINKLFWCFMHKHSYQRSSALMSNSIPSMFLSLVDFVVRNNKCSLCIHVFIPYCGVFILGIQYIYWSITKSVFTFFFRYDRHIGTYNLERTHVYYG